MQEFVCGFEPGLCVWCEWLIAEETTESIIIKVRVNYELNISICIVIIRGYYICTLIEEEDNDDFRPRFDFIY